MGGWKKEGGVEKLTNDIPPQKMGFGPPLVRYVFHPLLGVSALFFLYKNPRQKKSSTVSRKLPTVSKQISWAHALLKGAIITDSQKIQEIIPRRKDIT